MACHAGVIEEQIDPAVSRRGDIEEVPHRILVTDICRDGLKQQIGMGRCEFVQSGTPPPSEHHCPAVTAERRSDRGANATPCSGNHRDLVTHRCPNPCRLVRLSGRYSPLRV